jgi:hypothetical protein
VKLQQDHTFVARFTPWEFKFRGVLGYDWKNVRMKNEKFILKHPIYSQCHADAWYPHYVIIPRPTTVGRSPMPWMAWPHKLCPANWSSSKTGVYDVISHDSWSSGSFVHIPPKCVWYHVVMYVCINDLLSLSGLLIHASYKNESSISRFLISERACLWKFSE